MLNSDFLDKGGGCSISWPLLNSGRALGFGDRDIDVWEVMFLNNTFYYTWPILGKGKHIWMNKMLKHTSTFMCISLNPDLSKLKAMKLHLSRWSGITESAAKILESKLPYNPLNFLKRIWIKM